jgi:hypothetical protein
LIEKIKLEKLGNNPEITKVKTERDALREQADPVKKQIEELELTLKGPRAELNDLKVQKDSLQKELDVFKVEALNSEIRAIQQRLGFSALSVSEEKKLIERKQRLEDQKPRVEKFCAVQAKIKKIQDSNSQVFTKLKSLNETKRTLGNKIKELSTKLGNFMENKKQNDPNIKNLEVQKDSIYEEKKKCIQKKRDLDDEYEEKHYNWREQQKIIKYIKEATEKLALLKKNEERYQKRKEREAKENAEIEAEEGAEVKKIEVEPFAYEMHTCEWLAAYFRNSIGANNKTPVAIGCKLYGNGPSKIDEDITKGLIKPMANKEEEDTIGLSGTAAPKKKTKGPKVSKREQKAESTNLLTLDIGIIKKIQDIKLSPPALKSEIPNFIALLEKTQKDFNAQATGQKSQPEVKVEPKVEEKKTEAKVEAQVESKIEAKVEAKVESKVEAKVEPKAEEKNSAEAQDVSC